MPSLKETLAVILLFLGMVFLWLSAHDNYVKRINQQQQATIQALTRGNHDLSWSLQDKEDLVTGFGSGWQQQVNGLMVDTGKAELSLAFYDRFIVPDLYHHLTFSWIPQQGRAKDTQLLLEFSQVDSDDYYYSPAIKLTTGDNQIDLSQLSWTTKQGTIISRLAWQDLPVLNTMVWRFSQTDENATKALLADIEMPQSTVMNIPEEVLPLSAISSNQLRHHWQKQRLNIFSPPVMQAYVAFSPWWLYFIGIILILSSVQVYRTEVNSTQKIIHIGRAFWVMVLVAGVVVLMQTKWLFNLLEQQSWLAVIIFLLPTLLMIKSWLKPKNTAGPVWLITLMVASVIIFVDGFDWTFILDLPLYLLWALAQQVILGPLVSDYLHQKGGFSAGFVTLLCGVFFALLHLPNQMLMLATFISGLLWSYSWLRYQNIYANAVSHALLALLFYQTMPAHLLGTARIGWWF